MIKKRFLAVFLVCSILICHVGCGKAENSTGAQTDMETEQKETEANAGAETNNDGKEAEKMKVQIGDKTFTATLEENDAAQSFIRMMETAPIVIKMSDYAGFEKVGALGTSLPASNSQITTKAGDIVLYNGNQIVIFYGSNSWSYTMLGKIDDLTGWDVLLARLIQENREKTVCNRHFRQFFSDFKRKIGHTGGGQPLLNRKQHSCINVLGNDRKCYRCRVLFNVVGYVQNKDKKQGAEKYISSPCVCVEV